MVFFLQSSHWKSDSKTWCAKVCWSWKQSSFFFCSRLGAYNSRNVQRAIVWRHWNLFVAFYDVADKKIKWALKSVGSDGIWLVNIVRLLCEGVRLVVNIVVLWRHLVPTSRLLTSETHFVLWSGHAQACPLRRTKRFSEVSNREIVATLRGNRYLHTQVYVFGYTTSWMSRLTLSGLAIKIRGYFCPPRWVIANKIATLRDDRHMPVSAYVFGYLYHLVD